LIESWMDEIERRVCFLLEASRCGDTLPHYGREPMTECVGPEGSAARIIPKRMAKAQISHSRASAPRDMLSCYF
jgi:hypothetical protein